VFELNGHIQLNQESDSWRELPVKQEEESDILPGNI